MGPLPAGAVLGSYRVVELLGEGGMGYVYLGEHARIGRRVAIKVLRPDLALRPEVVARFFDEARSVNQIRHAHIIDVYDFVESDRTRVFLVMEHLIGTDLRRLLEKEGPLPVARAGAIAVQIADALMAVHARDIVHRDLKPENIFLVERGGLRDFVKLLDFGIAKLAREPGEVSHTQTGMIFGTPQFMSPEQARGLPVDARSDIYSLGMVLYTLLSGKPAFEGEGYGDIMVKQISEPPAPLRERTPGEGLSPALERIVMRALRKDREQRFQSMVELRNALMVSVEGMRLPPSIELVGAELAQAQGATAATALVPAGSAATGSRPAAATTFVSAGRGRRWFARPAVAVTLAGAAVIAAAAFLAGTRAPTAAAPAAAQAGRGLEAAPAPSVARAADRREAPARTLPSPPSASTAPSPPSAPSAMAAPPAKVTVSFRSRPDGADVVAADGEIVCRTPCSTRLPASAEPRRFRARKGGYADAETSAPLAEGGTIDFPRLERRGGGRAGARPVRDRGIAETLDPFR